MAERTEEPQPAELDEPAIPGAHEDGDTFLAELGVDPADDEPEEDEPEPQAAAEPADGDAPEPKRVGSEPEPEAQDDEDPIARLEKRFTDQTREWDQERAGLRRELFQMRKERRELEAKLAQKPAADADDETPEDELLEQTWTDEGKAGIRRSAIDQAIDDYMKAHAGESGPAVPGTPQAPPITPQQQYLQDRYTEARESFISERPEAKPVVEEFEQAWQWLDREVAYLVEETGWTGANNNLDYFAHVLKEHGVTDRFERLFPQAGRADMREFIEVGLSGDHRKMTEFLAGQLGEGEGESYEPDRAPAPAPRDPARRAVPPHPSHTRRGRGAPRDERSTKEQRLAELDAKEPLEMTDAEYKEWSALVDFFEGEGEGRSAGAFQVAE